MYGIGDDVFGRLNNTKPVENRDPFIGEGKHRLVVLSLEQYLHQTHGPTARCTFEVVQSTSMPVGTRCVKLWFLTKPSKFPSQANDADRFADFVRKIKGAPDTHPVGQDCALLLRDRAHEQLMRGMLVDAYGVNTSKKADKPFVDVRWTNVQQNAQDIAAQRQRIETSGILAQPSAPPQQQYMQQPPYQPAPPTQYQASPYQPPPQQYPAPPYQPAPPTQPAPAPQQGGFLSQLGPPTGQGGGNPQGGNNGGGIGW